MNWNWFKQINGNTPKFWEDYSASFSQNDKEKRFVVFDCKTSGTDFKSDKILSIGAISVINDQIKVVDSFSIFLKQDVFSEDAIKINGIINNEIDEKYVEAEAVIQFLGFVENAILVGYQPQFNIEMLNRALERLELGRLKNEYMDITIMHQKHKQLNSDAIISLEELCDVYKIKKSDRHTAAGDAFIMAQIFLKLKRKLEI